MFVNRIIPLKFGLWAYLSFELNWLAVKIFDSVIFCDEPQNRCINKSFDYLFMNKIQTHTNCNTMVLVVHKLRQKKLRKVINHDFNLGSSTNEAVVNTNSDTKPIKGRNDVRHLQQLSKDILFNDTINIKNEELPPLTVSNEMDAKLYAFFALLLKSFVLGWYCDSLNLGCRSEFTKELVYLFAHICRGIQERINIEKDELVNMLVIDLPYLLNIHLRRLNDVINDPMLNESNLEDAWLKRYGNGLEDAEMMVNYRRVLVKGLVRIVIPNEIDNSRISKEFIVSLLEGVVLKNVVESFSDNFVIWDLIGKVLDGFNTAKEQKKEDSEKKRKKKNVKICASKMYRLLEFFIVESKYQMKQDSWMSAGDLTPLLSLIELMTSMYLRFPILITFVQVILNMMFKFTILQKFINNCLKRVVYRTVFTDTIVTGIVDLLRNMMFPEDEKFDMKPRYVPQDKTELQAVYAANAAKVKRFLKNNDWKSRLFIDADENDDLVDEKVMKVMNSFKYRRINMIFIQQVIDLLVCRLFPELQDEQVL